MKTDVLRVEIDGGVGTLTLHRPEKRNALNQALVDGLREALDRLADDGEVRVVALRGAGPDFCAGADLAELADLADRGDEQNLEDARGLGALLVALRRVPQPVVAVVHGRALAGGCGLASACDVVLAHEDAQLGYPEVNVGFVAAMVMTVLRRKVTEGRAFDLVASGRRVSAGEARELGLVTRVLSADAFEDGVAAYLADLAAKPPEALRTTKRLLYELDGLGFEDGIEHAARVNVEARATSAFREGVRRFLGRGRS